MKFKFLLLLFSLIMDICCAYSQQSSIVFTSTEDCKFIIYKPLDGFYNNFYPTDTIVVHQGNESVYRFTVDDWCVIKCDLPRKLGSDIYIEKDSTVRVHNTETGILFDGSNAPSNQLFYDNIIFREMFLGPALDSLVKIKNTDEVEAIINNIRLLPQTTFLCSRLDSLFAANEISKKCYEYSIKEVDYQIKSKMLSLFRDEINNYKPMSDTIRNYVSLIGKTFWNDKKTIFHCSGSYINDLYCTFLFKQLDKASISDLKKGFAKETLGPYSRFLLLKELTQLAIFFDAFILQYQYGFNEFDRVELYKYLQGKYPQSEAVRIIGKMVEDELKDTSQVEPVFLGNDSVANFVDLGKMEGLLNKYIFVDLWASWCLPCRQEFSHNKKVNTLLGNYENIEKLYISIDQNEKSWKEAIKSLKLSEYHLRASDKLLKSLKKEIYDNNAITIPCYLLLDPQGNILNDDLAHPSDIDSLKKQLDKYLNLK